MKIGFVFDDSLDKADGVQQYILTLGDWFSHHGHEVHYLVGQTERQDKKHIHSLSKNLQVHFNQNRMSTPLPAPAAPIKQLLAKERFDVLHVQMPYSPFFAAKVMQNASPQTAVIGTFHILPFSKLESLATKALSLMLWNSRRRFDAMVSVSEPAAKFARRRFGSKTEVLPNAVDLTRFGRGKRLKKYDDGRINIVYLGRLVERKGCMYLLKAIQVLHTNNLLQNVRVIIAGKGPLLPELERFVKRHHLSHHVQFLGFVPEADKPSLLASADIAVFPSTGGESFGIVLIEAMAAGSSVVIGGKNLGYQSVMPGRHDQLIDPTDTMEFVKTLKHFIRSKPARDQVRKWQAAHVQQYSVKEVGSQLLSIYDRAIKKRSVTANDE